MAGDMTANAPDLSARLSAAGYRTTRPRRVVWEVVTGSLVHQTADAIAARVADVDPSVNRSSVYRSLSLFEELGLVRQSSLDPAGATHWESAHPDEQFHMRCEVCGAVTHHTGDLVERVIEHLADDHGFRVGHVNLVVTGVCAACRDAGNDGQGPDAAPASQGAAR
jgi:Fe2+ or Zn2+ uptake regulation protein